MCKIRLQNVPDNTECIITFGVMIYFILCLSLQYFRINELYTYSPSAYTFYLIEAERRIYASVN